MARKSYQSVKIGKVPGGEIKEYALNGERTVKAILRASRITVARNEVIRLNEREVTPSASVKDGDVILILKAIKGA